MANNWLDKYEDGGYLGTTNVGRNYSPAWGGQFDMGGDIPGSVGFTYARTGDIPDNGKYAKKTLASAQNGKEMQFYQEGLDFQPKTISQKGVRIPPDNRARGDMQSSYPQIARMYDGPQRKALAEAIAKREDEQRARRIIESQPSVSQYTPNKELEAANRYKFAKQYAATHGGYADDEGNIEETFVDRIMDSKTAAKAWDNIVVPGFEAEMLVSGAGLVGQGLKAAGKYAVENTALKNAYKLNPLAEKLINANKSYRVTGIDAFEDFKNTGVLRSAQQGVPEGASFAEKAMSRPTGFPSFQKGYADMRYLPEEGGVVFETGLPTYKRGEINPVTGNQIRGRHYAHRAIDPTTGATLAEIPASDIRVFGGKPNWLKGYPEISKPTSVSSSVDGVGKNLIDLQEAQKFAQQYGYELPTNLERIAQSNQLTDRTIRGMMDRHNTFVRGVSTNWKEIGKKNPEILRHLEGKGFDLSTKEGNKAAAEYMATHIPINTGYGRASLDKEVFKRGEDALYTSNSIPTAEGYTYGQGYIVKGKKPTDFSSMNRQDWITKNNPSYIDEDVFRKMNVFNHSHAELIIKDVAASKRFSTVEQKLAEVKKRFSRNPNGPGVAEDLEKLDKYGNLLFKSKYENKLLRTERSELPTDPFDFLIKKEGDAKKISEWLKTQPYQKKMREANDLGESLSSYTWQQQKPIRDKIDILRKETNEMYNKDVQEYIKLNHPDYDPINKYAHYLHIGTPGEKILQPIKSWEITPEIWKNKSRGHSNTYSKKLSALEEGGVIKDDRGQWAHPGEITQIDSNDITMRGVNYPVLGIGADGEQMMMQPGEDYKFNKGPVTEFPMAQNGMRQEQKGLQNLEDLTNFTNYNKPTKGGWLDKWAD